MSSEDFYDILSVAKTASADELKRAYRKLAKEYHPDRNPDDPSAEKKFKEVQSAYDVLKDPEKRAQFDRFGPAAVGDWHSNPDGEQVYSWSSGGPEIRVEDLKDLFSAFGGGGPQQSANPFTDMFGRTGGPQRGQRTQPQQPPEKGLDVERRVNLSFEQAAKGTQVEVDIADESGQRQTLEVKIPAGVESGKRIRLRSRGGLGSLGGPRGDLYLMVNVRPHPLFRRDGKNVYIDVPLTIIEASLGTKVEVPTLEGKVSLTIPPGASSGAKLRLAGQGVKGDNGAAGDLYAVVSITAIKDANDEQTELLRQLAATLKK